MRHAISLALVSLVLASLAGCGVGNDDGVPVERVASGPIVLAVEGQGELRSSKPTPLLVPGAQWSNRQLVYVVADGTWVKEGDLVARFAAERSKTELAEALIEMRRTQLARSGTLADLGDTQGQLDVDLAQVAGLLAIAHRYASATQGALARNAVLDAVQDENFLTQKQGTLDWRKGQSATRGNAELALNDAQHATNENLVKEKRTDLAALDLHAPHAGLLVLESDWSGEKPHLGQSMWAGNPFASLPDPQHMEIQIALPQTGAAGVKEGLAVELAPLGRPNEKVVSKLSWVAAAAAQRDRESPVKYLSMKAAVPAESVERYHWAPGEQFSVRVILLKADQALTIPNIALESSGDTATVSVLSGTRREARTVHLGVRGPTRTQILDGLNPGEDVVLVSPEGSDGTATKSAGEKSLVPGKKTVAGAPAP